MCGGYDMELMYKNIVLGKIEITERESFWISGNFYPNPEASEFKSFFDALVCEDGFDESQFDEDLLDENNWYVCENGKIIGISYPAIYDDSEIGFRYR